MYGSSFCIVTRRPRSFSKRPSEEPVRPLPRELATPPVTKMCFGIGMTSVQTITTTGHQHTADSSTTRRPRRTVTCVFAISAAQVTVFEQLDRVLASRLAGTHPGEHARDLIDALVAAHRSSRRRGAAVHDLLVDEDLSGRARCNLGQVGHHQNLMTLAEVGRARDRSPLLRCHRPRRRPRRTRACSDPRTRRDEGPASPAPVPRHTRRGSAAAAANQGWRRAGTRRRRPDRHRLRWQSPRAASPARGGGP